MFCSLKKKSAHSILRQCLLHVVSQAVLFHIMKSLSQSLPRHLLQPYLPLQPATEQLSTGGFAIAMICLDDLDHTVGELEMQGQLLPLRSHFLDHPQLLASNLQALQLVKLRLVRYRIKQEHSDQQWLWPDGRPHLLMEGRVGLGCRGRSGNGSVEEGSK